MTIDIQPLQPHNYGQPAFRFALLFPLLHPLFYLLHKRSKIVSCLSRKLKEKR
jgi:hypothetical protein